MKIPSSLRSLTLVSYGLLVVGNMFLTLSRLDLRTIALAGQIFFNDTVVEETGGPSQQCNR